MVGTTYYFSTTQNLGISNHSSLNLLLACIIVWHLILKLKEQMIF